MKPTHHQWRRTGGACLAWLCLGLGLLPNSVPAQAEPELQRGRLSYATSPRVHRHSWAQLTCLLKNPDSREREVAIRMLMDVGGGMTQRTVTVRHVTIPAEAAMSYRTLALTEEAEQYILELFVDGRRMPGNETMILRLLTDREKQFAIINDSYDISFGSFANYEDVKERWRTAFFRASDLPESWIFFQNTHSVILLAPDFTQCSERQLNSLRDYVAQGGRLVIAHPEAVLALADSPLADMLPVAPLRMRQMAELPALAKYAPQFTGWVEERHPWLESEPVGAGITLLAQGELPIFRWRRYGLGEVRASMIPLNEQGLRQADAFITLAKVFLNAPPMFADRTSAELSLAEMTGFVVPGPGTVRRIFLCYFLLLAAVMVAGWKLRYSLAAWLLAVAMALAMTTMILNSAADGAQENTRLLAALETETAGVLEGFYSMFSPNDTTLDITAPDDHLRFCAVPPAGAAFRLGMFMEQSAGDPVEVAVHNARFGIRGLNVRANTSRAFAALDASLQPTPFLPADHPLPEVTLGGAAPAMAAWPLPAELHPPEAAWLLFPSATLPLTVDRGSLILPPPQTSHFQANEILRAVQEYLRRGCRKPSVCLAWLEETDAAAFPQPADTLFRGRRLRLLPVAESWAPEANGEIFIGPESLVLTAADSSTRMLMAGNEIRRDSNTPRMLQDMTLRFHLPPLLAELRPSRVELALNYTNPSGNLVITPVLLADPGAGMAVPANAPEIAGRREATGRYVFTDVATAFDRLGGTGLLRLKLQFRGDDGEPGGASQMRLNYWQITELLVSVAGVPPDIITERQH